MMRKARDAENSDFDDHSENQAQHGTTLETNSGWWPEVSSAVVAAVSW